MKIRPLSPNVILKPNKVEKKTTGGIILPEEARKVSPEGKVIAKYEGCTTVKIGDKVMFKAYGAETITVDKEELLLVSEEDLLAIL